jgi:hypothetical protein
VKFADSSRKQQSAGGDARTFGTSACDGFYKLLTDVRDSAGLTTTKRHTPFSKGSSKFFRRRLEVKDASRFLSALPVGARATVCCRLGNRQAEA